MNEKGSKVLMATIVCLLIIIAGLIGVISYNFCKASEKTSSDSNNSEQSSVVNDNIQDDVGTDVDDNFVDEVTYYQYYKEDQVNDEINGTTTLWGSWELKFSPDGSVLFYYNGTSMSGGWYKGTYEKSGNQLILSLKFTDDGVTVCDSDSDKRACNRTIKFIINSDNTLTKIEDSGSNVNLDSVYTKVSPSELKFIDKLK